MKAIKLLPSIVLVAALTGTADAVPPGRVIEIGSGKGPGKVLFDATGHAAKGLECKDCHQEPFTMTRGSARITMADHEKGNYCFACHNGTRAFGPREACGRCHTK